MIHNISRFIAALAIILLTAQTAGADTETVSYIDADGNTQTATATVLTGNEEPSQWGSIDLAAGWYVVKGNISYTNQINYRSPTGTIHIILADGAHMSVEYNGKDAIFLIKYYPLAIYGQSAGTGRLSVTSDREAIFASGGITINGGIVSATSTGNGRPAINADNGAITINGGQVIATPGDNAKGIVTEGTITLGLRSASDFITANGYNGTVNIKDGQALKDPSGNIYYGTLTDAQKSAIANVTLQPATQAEFIAAALPQTAADTYTISDAAGWDAFCLALQDNDTYNRFSGKTVRLGDDITVTRMAGGDGHAFTGTFDGGGHTLTVNYANTDNDTRTAPFSYVDGATIQNLIVGGTISGTAYRAAGIIGETVNTTSHITNCVSSVDISSGRYTGGFSIGGNVEIEGCVFNGKIKGTTYSGGFIGHSYSAQVIKNSLFAPQDGSSISGGTFYYNGGGDVAPVNSYYTQALGTAQGKATHTVTAGDNVTIGAIALTGTATQYTVSGITAYSGGGLQHGETLYYGIDDQLSLTLSNSATGAPQGYQYAYTASAGTLSGTTLTMPDQDVTISVNTAELAPIDWATVNQGNSVDDPYMIYNKDQLLLLAHRVNGTNGETANTYQGKYFKLGADITFVHPVAEPDDYDENYEAIGGYYNGTTRFFRGTFDGDDYTVSGIRIRKTGSDNADNYQGLFGCISSGANIRNVHLTDACIKGYGRVGGIVGGMDVAFNGSGVTVSGCSVTDSYITATSSSYGIICGSNTNVYSDGTLANNYYHGCTVNGTAVTSGKGCGSGNKLSGFSIADITANNGALPAYRLDLGANITTPPGTFAGQTGWLDTPPVGAQLAPENGFTLAGNHYFASGYEFTPGSTLASGAAQGYTPRATLDDELLDLYTPTGDAPDYTGTAIARLTITADCDGKTLKAALRSDGQQHDVSYMTAGGNTQTAQAVALDGTEKSLAAGWYFVGQPTVAFDHTLNLGGDVNLILVDGNTMKVSTKTRDGISAEGHSLHIYGQTEGTGALNAQTKGKAVVISITNGTLGIHGGNVNANAKSTENTKSAIRVERATAGDALVIDRGTLTANSKNSCGIYIEGGDVRINGGQVTATGPSLGIDISDNEDVAFSIPGILTLSGGTLTASSFYTSSGESWAGTLAIAPGLTYTDGTSLYDSTTETATLAALGGKTLRPCLVLNETAGVTPLNALAGQANVPVIFTRTFSANVASTICLPFSISADQAAAAGKFYSFAGVDMSGSEWVVTMQETNPSNLVSGELTANTPYLFMPSVSNDVTFSATIGTVADTYTAGTTTSDGWTYQGTYKTIEWPSDPGNIYGFASGQAYGDSGDQTEAGKFIRVHTGGIRPFRAYLEYNGSAGARAMSGSASNNELPETMTVRLIGADGQTSAIGTLDTRTGEATFDGDAWYTLDGRRLSGKPAAKGLYIKNGKKTVIK